MRFCLRCEDMMVELEWVEADRETGFPVVEFGFFCKRCKEIRDVQRVYGTRPD